MRPCLPGPGRLVAVLFRTGALRGHTASVSAARDYYVGKSVLQPREVPRPACHNNGGTAVLKEPGRAVPRLPTIGLRG